MQPDLKTAICVGELAVPHEPTETVQSDPGFATCPRCGKRFERDDPSGTVSPAAWPKDR